MKKPTYTLKQLRRVIKSDNRGQAMKEIGIAPTTFYRLCHQHGLEFRRNNSSYVLTAEDDELIAALSSSGYSSREIAAKFDVCHVAILKRLRRRARGIPPKTQFSTK